MQSTNKNLMELKISETSHPNKHAGVSFENLIAIEQQKDDLLNTLHLLFDKDNIEKWHKKHHHSKLSFLSKITDGLPLVILAGDVGCGKTALANAIATPLGKKLDKRILCFETPSNVGEISNRITEAFSHVKAKLGKNDFGILIIDEADDLATSREQNQAHHEDRAGLNVLIKQIDLVAREEVNLAVILITNRVSVLDPAVIRRATQTIIFERPDKHGRKKVFKHLFDGVDLKEKEIVELVDATERKDVLYSFSDLIQKVGKQAVVKAIQRDVPFSKEIYLEVLETVAPSPTIS
jgi:SpoVK/Ycf46/Vps4 family AAA+-type ATPase